MIFGRGVGPRRRLAPGRPEFQQQSTPSVRVPAESLFLLGKFGFKEENIFYKDKGARNFYYTIKQSAQSISASESLYPGFHSKPIIDIEYIYAGYTPTAKRAALPSQKKKPESHGELIKTSPGVKAPLLFEVFARSRKSTGGSLADLLQVVAHQNPSSG